MPHPKRTDPPPWWDLLLLKLGGLAVLIAGLSPVMIGATADLTLVGIGVAMLGGREALETARSRRDQSGSK